MTDFGGIMFYSPGIPNGMLSSYNQNVNNNNNKSDELRDPPSYLDEVKIGRGWVQN